jgi:Leu/Phe-tRNA-protein transferase
MIENKDMEEKKDQIGYMTGIFPWIRNKDSVYLFRMVFVGK